MRWKVDARAATSRIGAEPRRADWRWSGGMGGSGGGGLSRLLPMLLRFLGVKGTIFAILALGAYSYFSGGGLGGLLGGLEGGSVQTTDTTPTGEVEQSAQEKELVEFVSVVLADTEQTWHELFKAEGQDYREPRLVLFRGAVNSACGVGQPRWGLLLSGRPEGLSRPELFDDLKRRHDAPGDLPRPTWWRTRSGTTFRRCSGFRPRCRRPSVASAKRSRTSCR